MGVIGKKISFNSFKIIKVIYLVKLGIIITILKPIERIALTKAITKNRLEFMP